MKNKSKKKITMSQDKISKVAESAKDSQVALSNEFTKKKIDSKIRNLKYLIKDKNIQEALKEISSLDGYEISTLEVTALLNEIELLKKQENEQAQQTKTNFINDVYGIAQFDLGKSLTELLEIIKKAKDSVDQSMLEFSYYAELAKKDAKHFGDIYESLNYRYQLKPKSLDICGEILKIEDIKFSKTSECLRSLDRELRNLKNQKRKLLRVRKEIQTKVDKLLKESENKNASGVVFIIKKSTKMIAAIDSEIKCVVGLVSGIETKIQEFKQIKKQSKERVAKIHLKRSGAMAADMADFAATILSAETKKEVNNHRRRVKPITNKILNINNRGISR